MESSERSSVARRSAGEWLFQLTTITIGVLIALSFDALLRWYADRTLVNEARANIAIELEGNRSELADHLEGYEKRIARYDNVLALLDQQDAGVEVTKGEMSFSVNFPSLNDAAWRTAQQTGALALMDYADVQPLAEIYALQMLVAENLRPSLLIANHAASIVETAANPLALPPPARDALRASTVELRGIVRIDEQLDRQLATGYDEYLGVKD